MMSEITISCPYCGEANDILVDGSVDDPQQTIEDCYVCCRPIQLLIDWDEAGHARVTARHEDDA